MSSFENVIGLTAWLLLAAILMAVGLGGLALVLATVR